MTNQKNGSGLRQVGTVAAAMLFWIVSAGVSMKTLSHHPSSAVVRASMVVLGVAGLVTMLVTVSRLIFSQDEFSQRIHLIAIALTCAATAVLVMGADLLQAAGFVGYVPLQGVWMGMGVLWWLGIAAATRLYR